MLDDKVEVVEEIFKKHLPTLEYSLLRSKSVRNSLLAHYLLENLQPSQIMKTVWADSDSNSLRKLVIADEVAAYTGKSIIFLQSPKQGPTIKEVKESYSDDETFRSTSLQTKYMRQEMYEAVDNEIRIGRLYPGSSLNKAVMLCGIKLFSAIYGKAGEEGMKIDRSNDLSFLLEQPGFRGISEGADILHAANCYLDFFDEDPVYEARIEGSERVADLRRLLAFKVFDEHTFREDVRAENMRALKDMKNPIDEVFLYAVSNWNKDILLRMDAQNEKSV